MWKDILYVGLGGGIGSVLRYLTSHVVSKLIDGKWFFLGTFTANITGCFLIGLFSGWLLTNHVDNPTFRLLFIVGFCGGYTTFSTFASENLRLMETNQWGLFFLYTLSSVLSGILAVWIGMKMIR